MNRLWKEYNKRRKELYHQTKRSIKGLYYDYLEAEAEANDPTGNILHYIVNNNPRITQQRGLIVTMFQKRKNESEVKWIFI